jgi:hypothetical protein
LNFFDTALAADFFPPLAMAIASDAGNRNPARLRLRVSLLCSRHDNLSKHSLIFAEFGWRSMRED